MINKKYIPFFMHSIMSVLSILVCDYFLSMLFNFPSIIICVIDLFILYAVTKLVALYTIEHNHYFQIKVIEENTTVGENRQMVGLDENDLKMALNYHFGKTMGQWGLCVAIPLIILGLLLFVFCMLLPELFLAVFDPILDSLANYIMNVTEEEIDKFSFKDLAHFKIIIGVIISFFIMAIFCYIKLAYKNAKGLFANNLIRKKFYLILRVGLMRSKRRETMLS